MEVWSYGTAVAERNTVPGSMYGDTTTAGTRTPKRLKANVEPRCGPLVSGRTAVHGGGTWS